MVIKYAKKILLFKVGKKCCPQILLEECKCPVQKKNLINTITEEP